jgi:cephalosporin-C deacetylase-like acetyl esterase
MLETLSYFDVANFIGMVRCPIVGTMGWMDTVTSAGGQIAAFAQADKDELTLYCAPWGRHGADARTQQLFYRAHREFMESKPAVNPGN